MSPRRLPKIASVAFVTGFSGAMMPGPLLVAVVGQTAAQGFRAVIGLVTGHALLELVTVLLLVVGLRNVLERRVVGGAVGLAGGAALVWMGADMLASAGRVSLDLTTRAVDPFSFPKLLLWGAGVCAANPYFTGWWATVGAGQLASMAPKTTGEYLAFYLGHEASDYTWFALVGVIVITGRQWLTGGIYGGLIVACGCVILAIGAWFLFSGARLLTRRRDSGISR